ncbi:MAG: hypothetical protein QW597_06985 [Thermoplasmataceae archaeon]
MENHAIARIGDSMSHSTYYLFQNLTVPNGSTLYINNTHLIMVSSSPSGMSIDDYGSLYLNNSSLSTVTSNGSGTFPVQLNVGNASGNLHASLYLKNSSLQFGGSILAVNSAVTFIGSIIGCESQVDPDLVMALGMSFENCTIYSGNTIYDNFFHTPQTQPYIDGSMNYSFSNKTGPLSEEGYHSIPLSHGYDSFPDSYLDTAILNITYSGNDSSSNDYVIVSDGGSTIGNITLPSTGGIGRLENSTYSFKLPVTITRSKAYSSNGISVHYNFNLETTAEIWNISLDLISNDTESFYGLEHFNVLLYNSTMISLRDSIGLGFQEMYSYGYMLNPQKNMIIGYGNSSVFIVGDYSYYSPEHYCSPPFLMYNNSRISVYKIEQMQFITHYGAFYNATPVVTPCMIPAHLDSNANASNGQIAAVLEHSPLVKLIAKDGPIFEEPLIEATMNASEHPEYLGDYSVSMASSNWYFSISTFPWCLSNQTMNVFPLNLPAMFLYSLPKSVSVGYSTFQVGLQATSGVTITGFSAELSGRFGSMYLVNTTAPISKAGGLSSLSFNCYVPISVNPGVYDLILRIDSAGYFLTGENLTDFANITVLPDIHPSVSSFIAGINGRNVSVSFNLSNSGLNSILYNVVLRTEFSDGEIGSVQSLKNLSANSFSTIKFNLYAPENISGFQVLLIPQNTNLSKSMEYNYTCNLTVNVRKPHSPASEVMPTSEIVLGGSVAAALALISIYVYDARKKRVYYFCTKSGETTKIKRICKNAQSKKQKSETALKKREKQDHSSP